MQRQEKLANQYSKLDPCTFLEHVYINYHTKNNSSEQFLESVKNAINETENQLRLYFEGYSGPSSVFLASIMELLITLVTNLEDTYQIIERLVVPHLLNENV